MLSRLTVFYYRLQLKKCMKIMRNTLISVLCIVFIFAGSALLVKALLQKQDSFEKVKVGIVILDEDQTTKKLFRLLYAMESVNNICSFDFVDEDTVQEQLESGELKAALIISPDFYNDVNNGRNTPVTLLLGEEEDFETTFFYELVMDGCELIRTTEAQIYAISDEMEVYETKITVDEAQDMFSMLYIEQILRRYDAFEELLLSPTGTYNLSQHYMIAVLSALLLMLGLNFGILYQKDEMEIIWMLQRDGMSKFGFSMIKTGAMAVPLWVSAAAIYGGGCLLCLVFHTSFMSWQWSTVLMLGMVAIGVASYFHLIYSWFGNSEKSGMILFVLNLLMLLFSGAVLPVSYMPDLIEKIYKAFPLTIWWRLMGNGIFQSVGGMDVLKILLQTLLFELIGALGICKRM